MWRLIGEGRSLRIGSQEYVFCGHFLAPRLIPGSSSCEELFSPLSCSQDVLSKHMWQGNLGTLLGTMAKITLPAFELLYLAFLSPWCKVTNRLTKLKSQHLSRRNSSQTVCGGQEKGGSHHRDGQKESTWELNKMLNFMVCGAVWNMWNPQKQGKSLPIHQVFSIALYWIFMKKTAG